MPDAPANAWTGQHLLWWLQAHPQWLDRPVHLLLMTGGEEDAYLTTAEEDRFDPGDPNVISLIADGPEAAVALPCTPGPEWQCPGCGATTRARMADYPTERDGAALITAERRRQVEVEGWTAQHDDNVGRHDKLARAASVYAMPLPDRDPTFVSQYWPWEQPSFYKPTSRDRVRELTKAGALIAAEIDRLQRAAGTP